VTGSLQGCAVRDVDRGRASHVLDEPAARAASLSRRSKDIR